MSSRRKGYRKLERGAVYKVIPKSLSNIKLESSYLTNKSNPKKNKGSTPSQKVRLFVSKHTYQETINITFINPRQSGYFVFYSLTVICILQIKLVIKSKSKHIFKHLNIVCKFCPCILTLSTDLPLK